MTEATGGRRYYNC